MKIFSILSAIAFASSALLVPSALSSPPNPSLERVCVAYAQATTQSCALVYQTVESYVAGELEISAVRTANDQLDINTRGCYASCNAINGAANEQMFNSCKRTAVACNVYLLQKLGSN